MIFVCVLVCRQVSKLDLLNKLLFWKDEGNLTKMGNKGSRYVKTLQDYLHLGDTENVSAEIWSQVVEADEYLGLKLMDLDYDNIVFEGGGCKGIAYCGAIKVSSLVCLSII